MSITIHQSPTGYPSAHSELWHVVESTNKAVNGFQYVFDIYKSGNLITRVKNSPYGTNKVGVLDVHNIVRSSLSTDNILDISIGTGGATLIGQDKLWTDYDVRYGEVSGGVTTTNIASGTYRVYNNYIRSESDNASSDITGAQFLTNRPDNTIIYKNGIIVFSYFAESGQNYRLRFYRDNVLFDTDTATGNGNAKLFYFTETYFNASDESKLELSGSVSGVISTKYLKKKCAKYDVHSLVFLNAYGAYDSFTFVHGKKTSDTQKKSFEKLGWELNNSNQMTKGGNYFNYENKKVYASSHSIKMQLTSDILSTDEYNWLAELINSPLVYYYDYANDKLLPVMITDTNFEFKDDRINKTDTLTVNIEFSDMTNTQFR